MKARIRVGTSGWNYPHWKEVFYPSGQLKSQWLEFYCTQFDTVELNATFYRQPRVKTFENWHFRTPQNFLWAVKASRYITHVKRLTAPQDSLEKFYAGISALREKLGPVLLQLPPSLAFDKEVVRNFCALLDPKYRYTLEVRHPSWIDDLLFEILQEYNIAFCIADTAGKFPYYEAATADFVYIRLHGSQKLYASEYSEEELAGWAEKISAWGKETFVYFDNDFEARAVKNARQLKQLLDITTTRAG